MEVSPTAIRGVDAEMHRLQRENTELREALEYYADRRHWDSQIVTGGGTVIEAGTDSVWDGRIPGWSAAQEALAANDNQENKA